MKTISKIIFIFCVLFSEAKSQTYFNKVYDYDNSHIYSNAASSVIELSNGDFLIGSTKFYSSVFGALHFIRINASGDTIVSKRFPKQHSELYTGASGSLIKTNDGNYVQAGIYSDSSSNYNALLVKLTEDGDTLWTKTYGGVHYDNANIVHQTADSGFVIMGSTQSFSMGSAADFYLVKTDKNGNLQWQRNYGTTLAEDCVSGQITLDGGYIMSGIKNSLLFIVKTDANGNFQWQKQFAGTAGTGFVKQLADSTYLLLGAKFVSGLSYQAYMAKLTKTGSIIWEKTYGGSGDQQFYTVPVVLSDGSIVCAGENTNGVNKGLLIKTDSSGNELWERIYSANASTNSYVYDLKATADNGFIMVGSGNITGQDAWVVKVDEFGCEVSNCSVGIEEVKAHAGQLSIYPNPATNHVTVEINNDEAGPTQLIIYDVFGKEMAKEQVNNSNSLTINIQHFANGMYLLVLKIGNEIKDKQKLIISK